MHRAPWSPMVWDYLPRMHKCCGPQVWCPWNVFPGCTSAHTPRCGDVFPECTGAVVPRRTALKKACLLGCIIGLHSLERGYAFCRFQSITCYWKSLHTEKRVCLTMGKWALCSLGDHISGASSPLVTPAPCPSTQPTIKCFTTCRSACYLFPALHFPKNSAVPRRCPVSSCHSPGPTPSLSSKNWFYQSKPIPQRVSSVNKDGAAISYWQTFERRPQWPLAPHSSCSLTLEWASRRRGQLPATSGRGGGLAPSNKASLAWGSLWPLKFLAGHPLPAPPLEQEIGPGP